MANRAMISGAALLMAACQQAQPTGTAPDQASAAATPADAETSAKAAPTDAASAASPASTRGIGLCAADEPALFSCRVRTGKVASVCGAEGPDGRRFAQYRYGRSGSEPELTFPATPAEGQLAFASTPYSGGGEAQLMFTRGDVHYVVYSRTVRTRFDGEGNDPDFQDGVAVMHGEQLVSRLACTGAGPKPIDYDLSDRLAGDAPAVVMLPE